jgi:hypothetical protein
MIHHLPYMVVSNALHHDLTIFIITYPDGTCSRICQDLFNLQTKPNNIERKKSNYFDHF